MPLKHDVDDIELHGVIISYQASLFPLMLNNFLSLLFFHDLFGASTFLVFFDEGFHHFEAALRSMGEKIILPLICALLVCLSCLRFCHDNPFLENI